MKSFSRSGYRIVNASFETKLIYSFFLLFTVAGFVTIGLYQCRIIGWGVEAVVAYYQGNEAAMMFPKAFLQLLEVSHAHAFIMGIIYLTLAHILVATRLGRAWKLFLVIGGFVVTFLDLIGPWLLRYGDASWAIGLIATWLGLWVIYAAYVVIPLVDMWLIPPPPED